MVLISGHGLAKRIQDGRRCPVCRTPFLVGLKRLPISDLKIPVNYSLAIFSPRRVMDMRNISVQLNVEGWLGLLAQDRNDSRVEEVHAKRRRLTSGGACLRGDDEAERDIAASKKRDGTS